MKTEKEKMQAGEIYDPTNPRLVYDRYRANRICTKYNKKVFLEINRRSFRMRRLLHTSGYFWIKPPFYCDYGYNIYLGKDVMLNYGCVLLDVCPIRIGNNTIIGPCTQIYTASHSLSIVERRNNQEFGKPVTIGNDVWIGGNVTILPGVTIGDGAVIGAGSVVTCDIPKHVIAAGNPCHVIRENKNEKE